MADELHRVEWHVNIFGTLYRNLADAISPDDRSTSSSSGLSLTKQRPNVSNSSILAVLIPLYFEGIQFQTQSPGKGTRSCRGALSPLPDLWTAQWGGWKLRPLKDYLDFSQAYWDNLRAKSLCSFYINLQSERCQSRVVRYVSVCILNERITECSHGFFNVSLTMWNQYMCMRREHI